MQETERARYWDGVADAKTFTHPLDTDVLARFASRDGRVLDCGCGYGRLLEQLHDDGWPRVVGVDFSIAMLARAHDHGASVARSTATALALRDASVDAVLAFAVVTCVPEDDTLDAIIAEWRRVLRPGGALMLSDCALGDDARNRARYECHAARGLPYGVFDLDEGMRFRHFDPTAFEQRLKGFDVTWRRALTVTTMNGHEQPAFQLVARRR